MENNEDPTKKQPNDPLSDIFGINPLEGKLTKSGQIIIPDPTDDYNYSRQNIVDIIDKANQYLQAFGEIALSAQEPRHFEVLTNMITALIDANERLVLLKKHEQDIKAREVSNSGQTINNNLFVGSTSDFQDLLENMSKKKE